MGARARGVRSRGAGVAGLPPHGRVRRSPWRAERPAVCDAPWDCPVPHAPRVAHHRRQRPRRGGRHPRRHFAEHGHPRDRGGPADRSRAADPDRSPGAAAGPALSRRGPRVRRGARVPLGRSAHRHRPPQRPAGGARRIARALPRPGRGRRRSPVRRRRHERRRRARRGGGWRSSVPDRDRRADDSRRPRGPEPDRGRGHTGRLAPRPRRERRDARRGGRADRAASPGERPPDSGRAPHPGCRRHPRPTRLPRIAPARRPDRLHGGHAAGGRRPRSREQLAGCARAGALPAAAHPHRRGRARVRAQLPQARARRRPGSRGGRRGPKRQGRAGREHLLRPGGAVAQRCAPVRLPADGGGVVGVRCRSAGERGGRDARRRAARSHARLCVAARRRPAGARGGVLRQAGAHRHASRGRAAAPVERPRRQRSAGGGRGRRQPCRADDRGCLASDHADWRRRGSDPKALGRRAARRHGGADRRSPPRSHRPRRGRQRGWHRARARCRPALRARPGARVRRRGLVALAHAPAVDGSDLRHLLASGRAMAGAAGGRSDPADTAGRRRARRPRAGAGPRPQRRLRACRRRDGRRAGVGAGRPHGAGPRRSRPGWVRRPGGDDVPGGAVGRVSRDRGGAAGHNRARLDHGLDAGRRRRFRDDRPAPEHAAPSTRRAGLRRPHDHGRRRCLAGRHAAGPTAGRGIGRQPRPLEHRLVLHRHHHAAVRRWGLR